MKFTLRQLQLFVAVVETESLTHAANKVCVSQPAASLALTALEQQLGRHLFDRVGKRLVLNESGTRFYPKAGAVIEMMQKAEHTFAAEPQTMSGVIRVGMSMTIGDYIAPAYLMRFMQRYPDVRIIQTVANSDAIVHALEKFQLDIGFIEAPCVSEQLSVELWGVDELVFFTAPQHPLASQKTVTKNDLENAHWVMRERGSGTRAVLERHIQPKKIGLEVGSTTALKKIVAYGDVIACISQAALQEELQQKKLVKLNVKNSNMKRQLFQLVHREKHLNELVVAFMQILKT